MSQIVVNHGGTIDKFMGDAIMALFGAPLHYPDHARRACLTALEMQATLKALGREGGKLARHPLKIGVGINTGVASVGNMGSETLFDYTAIGDNVNLASRLEALNKYYQTEIIISASTAQALDQEFVLRQLDLVRVKGRKKPVAIYELLGMAPPDPVLAGFLQLYHEGLELFRRQRWNDSINLFSRSLEFFPDDHHSRRYLKLARQYLFDPPGPEWLGSDTDESG